jgi:hypothetical protein
MKITKRQLRRIISESLDGDRVAGIEQLIYDGEYGAADAQLVAFGRELSSFPSPRYERALKEYDRLVRMLEIHSAV